MAAGHAEKMGVVPRTARPVHIVGAETPCPVQALDLMDQTVAAEQLQVPVEGDPIHRPGEPLLDLLVGQGTPLPPQKLHQLLPEGGDPDPRLLQLFPGGHGDTSKPH